MSTVVLSVRVKRELKEEAERLGIDVRSIVEKALIEEISRIKKMRFKKLLREVLKNMNISVDEWIEAVKEERRER